MNRYKEEHERWSLYDRRQYYNSPVDYNIDYEFVKNNLNSSWNWTDLSKNKRLNLNFVIKNQKLPWDWTVLSARPDLSWHFVSRYSHLPWNWCILLQLHPKSTHKIMSAIKMQIIKEELIAEAFHPSRVEKWLEAGGIELVETMFG